MIVDVFPADVPAGPRSRVVVASAGADPPAIVDMVDEGSCCQECGNYRWTLTNRRVCCLDCSVPFRVRDVDRATGLYHGEVVVGWIDSIDMIIHIDIPIPKYIDPNNREPNMEAYTKLDELLIAMSTEVRVKGWRGIVPTARPAPVGPHGMLEGVTYTGADMDELRDRERKAAERAHRRRTTRPRRNKKFKDDPSIFTGGSFERGYDEFV